MHLNLMIMVFALAHAFCNVSVLPLKSEPDHRAEQVSQLLFGEGAEIIEVNSKDWAYINTKWDGYKGWCKFSQLSVVSRQEYGKTAKYFSTGQGAKIALKEREMWLPAGSELRLKVARSLPEGEGAAFKGKKLMVSEAALNCENLKNAALDYLYSPYQWGGRSAAGIDCSGLTQMAFKLCNHSIPRDASQQANEGELVDFLQNAQCGDLAFFDNKEGKIVHVGILLDNQTIIHAGDSNGRVVVDKIDQGGIISVSLRKRTHNLRLVKRIIKGIPKTDQ